MIKHLGRLHAQCRRRKQAHDNALSPEKMNFYLDQLNEITKAFGEDPARSNRPSRKTSKSRPNRKEEPRTHQDNGSKPLSKRLTSQNGKQATDAKTTSVTSTSHQPDILDRIIERKFNGIVNASIEEAEEKGECNKQRILNLEAADERAYKFAVKYFENAGVFSVVKGVENSKRFSVSIANETWSNTQKKRFVDQYNQQYEKDTRPLAFANIKQTNSTVSTTNSNTSHTSSKSPTPKSDEKTVQPIKKEKVSKKKIQTQLVQTRIEKRKQAREGSNAKQPKPSPAANPKSSLASQEEDKQMANPEMDSKKLDIMPSPSPVVEIPLTATLPLEQGIRIFKGEEEVVKRSSKKGRKKPKRSSHLPSKSKGDGKHPVQVFAI